MKFLLITCLLFLNLNIQAQTAKEVIIKADQKMRGKTSQGEMSMTIVRPDWTRTMTMKSWSKGTEYSMVLVTSPQKDKGSAFLKRKKEMWNWVPSIERTIKIAPSMMMQSWMGSDFTNDDLIRESSVVHDYEHKIIKSEKIGEIDCWKIELMPKAEAAVVWGKINVWIDKKSYNQLKVEYYDEDGELINIMNMSDIKKFGDREIPAKMEMIPVGKKGYKTVMEYKNLVFDKDIDETFFSEQNLRKVR